MIECPRCGREYLHDHCLGRLVETIRSERMVRPECAYCQKPYVPESVAQYGDA